MKQKFKDMVIRHEGMKFHPYKCTARKLTIAIGRNLESKGITDSECLFLFGKSRDELRGNRTVYEWYSQLCLTKEQCLYLFNNDLAEVVSQLVQFKWFTLLNEARQAVLIDMVFNLGFAGFLKFKKTIHHIQKSEFEKAASEMLNSKWRFDVGNRALELSEIMRKGSL